MYRKTITNAFVSQSLNSDHLLNNLSILHYVRHPRTPLLHPSQLPPPPHLMAQFPKRSSSYSSAVLAIACARPLHPSQTIPSHHCPVASNLFTNPASAIFRPPRSMPHTAASFFAAFAVLSSQKCLHRHVFPTRDGSTCLHHLSSPA